MFRRLCVFVLLLAVLAPAAHADFKKTKIAVLDFTLQGSNFETKDMGKIVAEWFITAMVKEGRFDVVERSMLEKILAEQKLAMSGIIDQDSASQLGKILGVKVIISGSVMKLRNVTEINARIIDVESASIIAAENVSSTNTTSLQRLVVQMSEKIIKNFPLEGYVVQRKGKELRIDLGRRAGVKQGMEFIVYKEGNVIKHPKTGEVLDVEQIETGKIKIVSVRGNISRATIVKETSPNAITYGQMVKSVRGPLKPLPKVSSHQASRVKKAVKRTVKKSKPAPALSGKAAQYARQLRSGNALSQRDAAKRIIRARMFQTALMNEVEKALLKGYKKDGGRNQIDAMSWLCKVLGASGNSRYRKTLSRVAKEGSSRKLRGYASKSLSML